MFASTTGTEKFAERFPELERAGHYRKTEGLTLSSIGIGTYLGNWDAQTDQNYTDAVARYVALGGNVIDTAANYRFQRSERNIGAALKILKERGFSREELFISTKGGFLPFDGEPPRDVRAYFEKEFVAPGIAALTDLVSGSHCMTPGYLQSQIDQSLRNLAIDGIDLFYVHNPESQLAEIDKNTFELRLAAAFERLEANREAGKIRFYGAATWNGFRSAPDSKGYLSLERMVGIARQVGGEDHGFRFIQLPLNLAMPEALGFENQAFVGKRYSAIEAAAKLGVSVVCSGSIMQGKLASGLPQAVRKTFGDLESDALTGIQFVRSAAGVTSALIGMSREAHVDENMSLAKIAPALQDIYREFLA